MFLLMLTGGLACGALSASSAAQETQPPPPAENDLLRPLTLAEVQAWTGRHPRLLFGPEQVETLRGRRAQAPYLEIYQRLLSRADEHLLIAPENVADKQYQGRDQMSHILQRLAFVGLLTGDEKYSRKAVELLLALGERGFPFHGTGEDGAGDLMLGLALAYDWSYGAMSSAERATIRRQVTQLAVALSRLMEPDGGFYGNIAHRRGAAGHHVVALAGGGLGLVSLAMRGEVSRDLTNGWQATADVCLGNYLREAFGADGAGIEGFDLSTYALHAVLPYVVARRRMDNLDPASGTALGSVASWYVYELLPGPAMLPINDSGLKLGSEDALAAMFAAVPDDPVHAWFYEATHGSGGRRTYGADEPAFCAGDVAGYLWYPGPPKAFDPASRLPLGKLFPSRGVAFVRSGWGSDEGDVLVSFHCPSRAHLGRWQMDVNQFTLHGYKAGWAADSGYGTRVVGGKAGLMLAGTSQAHNLMQIDGRDAAKPYGRMLTFMDEKDWALAVGDGSASFGLKTFRRYLAVGKRREMARYVVVIDEIEFGDAEEHEVAHFLHTGRGNAVEIAGWMANITAPDGQRGQFAVVAPRGAELRVQDFEVMDRTTHPRIEMKHKVRGSTYYVAVLIPGPRGEAPPGVITPVFAEGEAIALRVELDGVEDRICVLPGPEARPPDGFGKEKHRIQLTNGAFKKSLLFDIEEPGHDVPRPKDSTTDDEK